MGFLDGLSKLANKIDEVAGVETGLSDLVNEGQKRYDESVGNTTTNNTTSIENEKRPIKTPPNVWSSGLTPIAPYVTITSPTFGGLDCTKSYEIPEDFTETNCGALEITKCFVYMYDIVDEDDICYNHKPVFTDSIEHEEEVAEFDRTGTIQKAIFCEKVNSQYFLFRTKMEYFDQITYFYGYHEGTEKHSIGITYEKDVLGTDLEKKLIAIVDHAVESYKLNK